MASAPSSPAPQEEVRPPVDADAAAKPQADEGEFEMGPFGNLSVVTLLAGVVLYLLGWSYLHGYYAAFGLSLGDLTLDIYEVLLFAERTLVWPGGLWVALALAPLMGIFIYAGILRNRRKTGAITATGIGFLALLVVLPVISMAAVAQGHRDALSDLSDESSSLPYVSFVLKPGTVPRDLVDPTMVKGDTIDFGYRLLVHGKSGYYAFQPVKTDGKGPAAFGSILLMMIPDSNVLGVTYQSPVSTGKH